VSKPNFRGRKRGGLKQAIYGTGDEELHQLQADVLVRQEKVAQLELELLDMRAEVEAFEREVEARMGLLKRQIERLEKKIDEARRKAARRAQWGDRADSPDTPEDVVEQFRKTWKRSGKSSEPLPKKKINQVTKEELKTIYRNLAKRFHPDLTVDPLEKKWREEQMTKVNQAYSESDMETLLSFDENLEWTSVPSQEPAEDEITALRKEVKRLDDIIVKLESDLSRLINSESVRWMLDVSIARRQGRDLLRAMEKELVDRVDYLQNELASFQ
jgi:predicted  nucleic acid-binding Zn-ribbon protein